MANQIGGFNNSFELGISDKAVSNATPVQTAQNSSNSGYMSLDQMFGSATGPKPSIENFSTYNSAPTPEPVKNTLEQAKTSLTFNKEAMHDNCSDCADKALAYEASQILASIQEKAQPEPAEEEKLHFMKQTEVMEEVEAKPAKSGINLVKVEDRVEKIGDIIYKPLKITKGVRKDTMEAIKDLLPMIFYRSKSKERLERERKEKETNMKKVEVMKINIGAFKEGAAAHQAAKREHRAKNQDRLQVAGMSLQEQMSMNKLNASYVHESDHHDVRTAHHIALRRLEELKAKKQQQVASTQNKGGMDLNKVAEGGSLLSSTGGQGAG